MPTDSVVSIKTGSMGIANNYYKILPDTAVLETEWGPKELSTVASQKSGLSALATKLHIDSPNEAHNSPKIQITATPNSNVSDGQGKACISESGYWAYDYNNDCPESPNQTPLTLNWGGTIEYQASWEKDYYISAVTGKGGKWKSPSNKTGTITVSVVVPPYTPEETLNLSELYPNSYNTMTKLPEELNLENYTTLEDFFMGCDNLSGMIDIRSYPQQGIPTINYVPDEVTLLSNQSGQYYDDEQNLQQRKPTVSVQEHSYSEYQNLVNYTVSTNTTTWTDSDILSANTGTTVTNSITNLQYWARWTNGCYNLSVPTGLTVSNLGYLSWIPSQSISIEGGTLNPLIFGSNQNPGTLTITQDGVQRTPAWALGEGILYQPVWGMPVSHTVTLSDISLGNNTGQLSTILDTSGYPLEIYGTKEVFNSPDVFYNLGDIQGFGVGVFEHECWFAEGSNLPDSFVFADGNSTQNVKVQWSTEVRHYNCQSNRESSSYLFTIRDTEKATLGYRFPVENDSGNLYSASATYLQGLYEEESSRMLGNASGAVLILDGMEVQASQISSNWQSSLMVITKNASFNGLPSGLAVSELWGDYYVGSNNLVIVSLDSAINTSVTSVAGYMNVTKEADTGGTYNLSTLLPNFNKRPIFIDCDSIGKDETVLSNFSGYTSFCLRLNGQLVTTLS
jgi:hypothetical protein